MRQRDLHLKQTQLGDCPDHQAAGLERISLDQVAQCWQETTEYWEGEDILPLEVLQVELPQVVGGTTGAATFSGCIHAVLLELTLHGGT